MRFLFDEMLKKLATWCRIFGIYSECIPGKADDELLEHAKEEDLIFVTRDVPLSQRAEREGVRCVLIRTTDVEEQLRQIVSETGVEPRFPEESRCAACNGELEPVSREDVEVPPKVRSERFWRCAGCGKVFWEGGHWKRIKDLYMRVKEPSAD